MSATKATPPMTPPTIAPTFVECSDEGLGTAVGVR